MDKRLRTTIPSKSEQYNNETKKRYVVERRYLIYTKDLKRDMETLLLPVYMVPFL